MLQKKLTEKIRGQSYRSIKQLLMSNTSVKTCWTSTRQSLLTGLLALSCLWPPPHWFYYLCHPCDLERIQSQWLRNKIWVVEKIRGAREKAKAGEWGVSGVLHKTNKKMTFTAACFSTSATLLHCSLGLKEHDTSQHSWAGHFPSLQPTNHTSLLCSLLVISCYTTWKSSSCEGKGKKKTLPHVTGGGAEPQPPSSTSRFNILKNCKVCTFNTMFLLACTNLIPTLVRCELWKVHLNYFPQANAAQNRKPVHKL